MKGRKKVCIGIPCYQNVSFETLDDYMRFMYYIGRFNTEYDFFLAIKGKSEQFRARNAIVKSALSIDCDYLLMLDDDHVIDTERTLHATESYDFVRKLINHMEEDPQKGIVGALYFQRGGACLPNMMRKNGHSYTFMEHTDITRRLQQVDVTGGGCFLMNMKIFDKIPSPWFVVEVDTGTDIQICDKVREAGYTVWCDTSIDIGHLKTDHETVTYKNVMKKREEAREWITRKDIQEAPRMPLFDRLDRYKADISEYTKKSFLQLEQIAVEYRNVHFPNLKEDNLEEYYRSVGIDQLARNMFFHSIEWVVLQDNWTLGLFNPPPSRGLDFCCGSAPVGFDLAMVGHEVDLVDIPGTEADKFVRWRAQKYKMDNVGFELGKDYQWIMLLDAIEHFHPDKVEDILIDLVSRLNKNGSIITNFWFNDDHDNVEHIFMDKERVEKLFEKLGVISHPVLRGGTYEQNFRWVKTGE